MYLYKIKNVISETIYIGVTGVSVHKRFMAHKYAAKRGAKSKLYDAMRSYGVDAFAVETIGCFQTKDQMLDAEERILRYINAAGIKNYNIKPGGEKVWAIRDVAAWKAQLREKRQGRKPALGMHHTEANKKIFGQYGKMRWDLYGRYPKEVIEYRFVEANKKFGISKTHYYRLRKQSGNE